MMTDFAERTFSERDVPFTQWLTLMKLRTESPMSASELARSLGHNQGALTRVLDALEATGMVERRRSTSDRRSVELRLTAEGSRYVEAQLPIAIDALNHVLDVFSPSEVETMIDLLSRLLARLNGLKTQGTAGYDGSGT